MNYAGFASVIRARLNAGAVTYPAFFIRFGMGVDEFMNGPCPFAVAESACNNTFAAAVAAGAVS